MMKKTFQMQNLDCANCAAKMEAALCKIHGVSSASISFLAQKLVIKADEAEIPRIIKEATKICKKIEPDCRILF